MAGRDHDLVLLGATGFTGRLVAAELAERAGDAGVRWAIAGRDRTRLEGIRDELPGDVGVEVVDTHDLVGLLDLAGRTRVLATTVGPFVRHGELVVQACVRQGTHYADITGEPAFVDLVRDRYDGDARRRGVAVVNCCGFDSVPHDLGVQWTVSQLPRGVPVEIRGYVRAAGRPSGGTLASVVDIAAGRPRLGPAADPDDVDGRRVAALPPRIHRVARLDAYGVPLPTIDADVVLRSARALDDYGPDFRYGHYAAVRNPAMVAGGIAGAAVLAGLAATRPTRALARRLLPGSGQGPSAEQRAAAWFEVTFLARAGERRLVTRVAGGDPGYDETATMLAEAALHLARAGPPGTGGVVTPAVALGEPYRRRLREAGMRFEVVDG